jgi:hypothetical protein
VRGRRLTNRGGFGLKIERRRSYNSYPWSLSLTYIRDLKYREKFPPPASIGGKAKAIPAL